MPPLCSRVDAPNGGSVVAGLEKSSTFDRCSLIEKPCGALCSSPSDPQVSLSTPKPARIAAVQRSTPIEWAARTPLTPSASDPTPLKPIRPPRGAPRPLLDSHSAYDVSLPAHHAIVPTRRWSRPRSWPHAGDVAHAPGRRISRLSLPLGTTAAH